MRKIFWFLIFSVIFIPVLNAQEKPSEEYTVKKGDTLWDISSDKLRGPFLWPKVWKENPDIKNPDLIYPGQKIKIPLKKEREVVTPVKETVTPEAEVPKVEAPPAPPVEEPVVKEEIIKEEKPVAIVEEVKEAPKKYIIDKNLYIASGYISNTVPGIGEIISSPGGRTLFGREDIVYFNVAGTKAGDKFFVLRAIKKVKHPKSGQQMGYLIRILGIVETLGMDNGTPKGKIITSFEDIGIKDKLIPYSDMAPPVAPKPPIEAQNVRGYIVESHFTKVANAEADILYLDKGEKDGLQVGNVFSLISEVPVERNIGSLQIISLQPETATAMVLKSSEEIMTGGVWAKK
ncbi:MAG: LysM peptidoglycan-binding domain-containing protein [Nitrospirae bacterium]|nr:LysM peptidoglycan-binding domain-containing protein [Nitrospirota bacterium]